ncbi:DnaA ATPase domain-containing protein [Psychrobacter sp. FDAARGOS_221]|uniref:DnaA ATPase domain-containing protein n=1 Tax=Psychrobacter sp. FDAARGOS_221 TaxID=1975705 RepID=UPI00187D352E|nr:DnaA/Hda family protein [Psychrobacter sp. FDAARGOS_221]
MTNQLSLNLEVRTDASLSDFSGPGWSTIIDAIRQLHVGLIGQMYIYGSAATGKTHLLSAICESYREMDKTAINLSLKELVHTDVGVLAALESFDLVAIDDLEVIRHSRAWQEAIFHLINRSREGQGQLIFAAKTPATELPFELPDLLTRLIQSPAFRVPEGHNIADRKAMLESVMRRRGWQFDSRITEHLLQEGPHRIGGMLDILNVIQPMFSNLNRAHISKSVINQALEMIDEHTLMAELEDIHQEAQEDLLSKSEENSAYRDNLPLDF